MSNNWKEVEHLVQLIEKSISPASIVEHDVDLPVLTSRSGATRQCDIVIRNGEHPRQTTTIVEVQNRKSQVSIGNFGNWLTKLKQVGAQHLICVSRQPFPQSIKEEALLHGGSVCLVHLSGDTEPEDLPFDFIGVKYFYSDLKIPTLNEIETAYSKSEAEELGVLESMRNRLSGTFLFRLDDRNWTLDKLELLSPYLLIRDHVNRPMGDTSGEDVLEYEIKQGPPLYYLVDGKFIRVGLKFKYQWTHQLIERPVSILTYEQVDHGALAWVVSLQHDTPKGVISIKVPLVKSDGMYHLSQVQIEGPVSDGFRLNLNKVIR